jgi:CNT family concentrative nucleoside transporter
MSFLFKPYSKDGVDVNFVLAVFPGIIFFASVIQMLYFLGAMQWVVNKFAWFMVRLMSVSGAESCVAVASPFVGQGESALLVKPFMKDMTTSEIHTIMVSGFSTIAGSSIVLTLHRKNG